MTTNCEICGAALAHRYQFSTPQPFPEPTITRERPLCITCARRERRALQPPTPAGQTDSVSRGQLIAALDRFFAEAGVFDICARCHRQGTGCCPPTCRVMGSAGCDPHNRYGKTVFCAAFVCSPLINAIDECDPQLGRLLRWLRKEVGPIEYRLYEMISRTPADAREPERPLALPGQYPLPPGLERGAAIASRLEDLADEVLAIRRLWQDAPPTDK